MRKFQVTVLVVLLCVTGFGVMYAKVRYLGMPLSVDGEASVWAVEARVEFEARGRSAVVILDIPDKPENYIVRDEYFVSRDYGLNIETSTDDRRAEWSIRNARGMQRLYYRVELIEGETADARNTGKKKKPLRTPTKPDYQEPLASAIADTLRDVRAESADIFTYVSQLLTRMNSSSPDANIEIIRKDLVPGSEEWVERIRYVLAGARISTRMMRGIILDDRNRNIDIIHWLEVHNGKTWSGFDPLSGNRGYPENFVRWSTGSGSLLEVEGGRNAYVQFYVSKQPVTMTDVAMNRAKAQKSPLTAWSLYKLPISIQHVYRIMLMIPLGALVVVLMRTVIGVPTIGTFMPVLISIAFRETQLLMGIGLYCLIVVLGLTVRFYMERLQLLMVPRLSAVLIVVVMLMLGISLFSNELQVYQGFSVALFPIVILTMVIERLSIVWEESGAYEAIKEASGSLFVSIVGYLVMSNNQLEHLIFTFPELLLPILAICIAAGRYSGYRLVELFRFRDLAREAVKHVRSDQ